VDAQGQPLGGAGNLAEGIVYVGRRAPYPESAFIRSQAFMGRADWPELGRLRAMVCVA